MALEQPQESPGSPGPAVLHAQLVAISLLFKEQQARGRLSEQLPVLVLLAGLESHVPKSP